MHRSLKVLLNENYVILCTNFSHTAESRDAGATMVGRCHELLKQLSDYNLLVKMHFVLDVLEHASFLSLKFQKDDSSFSSINDGLLAFTLAVTEMKYQNGENVLRFMNEIKAGNGNCWKGVELRGTDQNFDFDALRNKVCDNVLSCVSNRFENIEKDEVLKTANVFDPKEWPPYDRLAQFGIQDIESLG